MNDSKIKVRDYYLGMTMKKTTMDDVFVFPDGHGVWLDKINWISCISKLDQSTFSLESYVWFFSVYTNVKDAHWNAIYNSEFEAVATREALLGKLTSRGVFLSKLLDEID